MIIRIKVAKQIRNVILVGRIDLALDKVFLGILLCIIAAFFRPRIMAACVRRPVTRSICSSHLTIIHIDFNCVKRSHFCLNIGVLNPKYFIGRVIRLARRDKSDTEIVEWDFDVLKNKKKKKGK